MQKDRTALIRLLEILSPKQRRHFWGIVAISLLAAALETASVASIAPFMALVVDPSAIQKFAFLHDALSYMGIESPSDAIFAVGCFTIGALILGNSIIVANYWIQKHFISEVRGALSIELFSGYLAMPYVFHNGRDASSLSRTIFNDVDRSVMDYLSNILSGFTRLAIVFAICTLLIIQDPVVAVGAVFLVAGSYFLIFLLVRGRQQSLGSTALKADEARHRIVIEALGGIKELRVLGRETEPARKFRLETQKLLNADVAYNLAVNLPRPLMEICAFGGILALTLALISSGGPESAVPTLALYTFAGYRLLPNIQQLYGSAIVLRYNNDAIESIQIDLRKIRDTASVEYDNRPGEKVSTDISRFATRPPKISFKGVSFSYPGAAKAAVSEISFTVPAGKRIGLVGRSGAGKSTILDLMLGLYAPSSGCIEVDGAALNHLMLPAWRNQVGYVPQHIFLANGTIEENIAYGLPIEKIDFNAVRDAAIAAQADAFIETIPDKYKAIIGERGIRLSGGQRQRIGIARALYHKPNTLFFDEATSALDGLTEDALMTALHSLSADRTVIVIAHRLRTVESCDQLILVEHGKIVAVGTYNQLKRVNHQFHLLAQAQ